MDPTKDPLPEYRPYDRTTLLGRAERILMDELRHEGFVQETQLPDPPEGTLRIFLREPTTNSSGAWDEEKEPPVVMVPGCVYIVKAVTAPSENRTTKELEFGVQRRHIRTLKEVTEKYQETTPDNYAVARVYWYIEKDGQFRYIDIEALEVLGRVIQSENLHGGGTVFIPVHKTAPMRDYPNDPYRAARTKYLALGKAQTELQV